MERMPLGEFVDRMGEMMPAIMREFSRRQSAELFKTSVTMPQAFIMAHLSRNPDTKMTDLAGAFGVSTAAMTGLIERLVKCGYVARVRDPEDRRIVRARLTPKGARLEKQRVDTHRDMTMRMFGKLTEQDRADYLRILTRIRETLAA